MRSPAQHRSWMALLPPRKPIPKRTPSFHSAGWTRG
jgi:hypothetical protein